MMYDWQCCASLGTWHIEIILTGPTMPLTVTDRFVDLPDKNCPLLKTSHCSVLRCRTFRSKHTVLGFRQLALRASVGCALSPTSTGVKEAALQRILTGT